MQNHGVLSSSNSRIMSKWCGLTRQQVSARQEQCSTALGSSPYLLHCY